MKNKREAAKLLARVIDERTIEVRDALFDSGVKISPNADKEELVDAVVDNFGMNKRLQRKIGGLALELQPNVLDQIPTKFRSQSGNNKLSPEAKDALLDTGGQVVGFALANFLSNRQARQQAEIQQQLLEAQAQSDLANAELVKQQLQLQSMQNINKASMTPPMRLFTGVLLVGALGTAYYFYMKSQKAAK
jgi:hypothetical protein